MTQFVAPKTSVISVRLNRDELHILTQAARFNGVKLSTYIKQKALKAAILPQVRIDE